MLSKISFRCATAYLLSALIICLWGCTSACVTLDKATRNAIATIDGHKSRSEHAVIEGKERFKNNSTRLQSLKSYYDVAYRNGNTFIDTVKLNLTADIHDVDVLKRQVEENETAVRTLEAYVNPSTKGTGSPIEDVIKAVTDAILKFWEKASNQKASKIEAIKKELEAHKWKEFKDVS